MRTSSISCHQPESVLALCFASFILCSGGTLSLADKDANDHEPTQAEREAVETIMRRLAEADNIRFLLGGIVVDEAGQPLGGVKMTVHKPKTTAPWQGSVEREILVVNSTFSLDLNGYSGVGLEFEKEGYHPAKLAFPYNVSGYVEEKITRGEKVDPHVWRKDDIRVVLEKIGQLADLLSYGAMVEYNKQGGGKVLDFDSPPHTPLRSVADLNDLTQLPKDCVYILADSDANRNVAVVEHTRPASEVVDRIPQRVKLVMNDPDGGFITFSPQTRKNLYHQMKTAPESGYQKELVLDADYFAQAIEAKTSEEKRECFFFFKIKNRYGKGRVGEVQVSGDRSTVKLGVQFRIQPDGSRNLETAEPVKYSMMETGSSSDSKEIPQPTIIGDNPASVPSLF